MVQYGGRGANSTCLGLYKYLNLILFTNKFTLFKQTLYTYIYFNPTGACNNMKWAVCDGDPCKCTLQFTDDFKQPLDCTKCEFSSRFVLELFNELMIWGLFLTSVL